MVARPDDWAVLGERLAGAGVTRFTVLAVALTTASRSAFRYAESWREVAPLDRPLVRPSAGSVGTLELASVPLRRPVRVMSTLSSPPLP